jgi:hypothetical protein
MKRITILTALFITANTWCTTNAWCNVPWEFKPKIEVRDQGFLLEGIIDDKYPITMYLVGDKLCNTESYSRWNYTSLLKGWYYYDNKKIKLPLIGYEKYFETTDSGRGEKIALYVPVNILDEISEKTNCELEKYREIFIVEKYGEEKNGLYSLQNMQWKMKGRNSFLPVKFHKIQGPNLETKVTITLYVGHVEMYFFNLTDSLSGLKDAYGDSYNTYIENMEILASKAINNNFYLIFSFRHPSIPGSQGFGHCGAGYEEYLGFLHISSLEMKEFRYYQVESCFNSIDGEYTYDKKFPEKGIKRIIRD